MTTKIKQIELYLESIEMMSTDPAIRRLADNILTHIRALQEQVDVDQLKMVIQTAKDTGWENESDLSIILVQAAQALLEFLTGSDSNEVIGG